MIESAAALSALAVILGVAAGIVPARFQRHAWLASWVCTALVGACLVGDLIAT